MSQIETKNLLGNSFDQVKEKIKKKREQNDKIREKINNGGHRKVNCEMQAGWSNPSYNKHFENVIIHVHGGGFVAMTSSSHLCYLINWAKEVCPVFSIDYRLAPYARFPELLEDVIRAYLWILVSDILLGFNLFLGVFEAEYGDRAQEDHFCWRFGWRKFDNCPNDMVSGEQGQRS